MPIKKSPISFNPIGLNNAHSQQIPGLIAGLITGILLVTYALSFAGLIFSGPLAPELSSGVIFLLLSAVIFALVIALKTTGSGILAKPQEAPAAMLGLLVSGVVAQLPMAVDRSVILSTTVITVALATTATGLICLLLGQFKLGHLIRYLPYPVIGGFLAGTGWLLIQGALGFLTQRPITGRQLPALVEPSTLIQWLPSLGIAVLIFWVLRRYQHPLILPAMILGSITLFYGVILSLGLSLSEVKADGLLLGPFSQQGQMPPLTTFITHANWQVIGHHSLQILTISFISVMAFLIKLSDLERVIEQDLNANQELKVTGLANIVAGLSGGIIGFHDLSLSTLSYGRRDSRSQWVGVITAMVVGATLVFGTATITYIPRAILGSILFWLGFNFLWEWLYDLRSKLPRSDYGVVLIIFAAVILMGFLEGIAIGLGITMILFVINYSRIPLARYALPGSHYLSKIERPAHQATLLKTESDQIDILILQGFLFFGTAQRLLNQTKERLLNPDRIPLKFLLLDFRLVQGVDASAILTLNKLRQLAQTEQFKVVLTQVQLPIQKQLIQTDTTQTQTLSTIFPDLDQGLEWCEEQILATVPWRRKRPLPLSIQLDSLFSKNTHVDTFMDYLKPQDYLPNDIIFTQGEKVTALFLLESGQVTLFLTGFNHQPKRIQTIGSGNPLGELCFFRRVPHVTTAIVDQPSTLYRLSLEAWTNLCQTHPEIAHTFQSIIIDRLSQRLTKAKQEITDLLQ